MKHCQICGTQFEDSTCPHCGEATFVMAEKPKEKPETKKDKRR